MDDKIFLLCKYSEKKGNEAHEMHGIKEEEKNKNV